MSVEDKLRVREALKKLRKRRRRRRKPRGVPQLGARLRRILWSWYLWHAVAIVAAIFDHWIVFSIFSLIAFVAFLGSPPEQAATYGLDHEFPIDSDDFLYTITGATDTPISLGNRVDIFNNGDEFYPAMLAAVAEAENSVTMENYIYWEGQIGLRFAHAVADRAREGVAVKLLLDAVGSTTISDEILEILEKSGCQVGWYHPIHWYTIKRINNRTHRKSLIVDGRIGFTGGAGIADHWLGHAEDEHHWRDMQIRIDGPAVVTLQAGFAHNWLETTNELITGPDFFPPAEEPGTLPVQALLSSPESGAHIILILYYLSIVCARKSILIANPYFVPDDAALETLVEAKKRGVDIKIMVSGRHNDNLLARRNSTFLYGDLLEAGIEIYEYNRTMLHHKIMIVDEIWSTVGTANFDNRSFRLNDESNICVYDKGFAAELTQTFVDDLAVCDRVDLDAWRKRGAAARAIEYVAVALREQV